MRSKDLRNLRKAFENLQGSFDEVMKSTKSRGRKAASKKVAVKNEDFDEDFADEDLEDEDLGDEDVEDSDVATDESDADVLETAEAIIDLVESLPEDVEEEVKDELLGSAADEVEDGVPVDEVVENVRRRVYNIRRKVNNARRARVKNARRIKNARRQRLFNAAVAEGLIKAAPKEYQSPISKFKNARKRYAWNDEAGDLNNGEGDGYRDAKAGDSIGSIESTPDDGYPENRDNNFWPNNEQSGKSEINTYNARVRRIINKARAYDALMNGLGAGCAGGSCPAGKVNLNNKDERDAYNAGVLQNDRYVLHNGRVYAFNEGEDAFVPADTTAAPAAPGDPEAAAEDAAGGPYYDEEQNALVIPLSGAEEQALEEDLVQDEEAPEGALDTAAVAAGADMPGAGGVPAASEPPVPSYNQRQRRRVRNSRGYRSVYNQKGKTAPKKTAATQETQVNNAAVETGLDIPSTFPTKKAE